MGSNSLLRSLLTSGPGLHSTFGKQIYYIVVMYNVGNNLGTRTYGHSSTFGTYPVLFNIKSCS